MCGDCSYTSSAKCQESGVCGAASSAAGLVGQSGARSGSVKAARGCEEDWYMQAVPKFKAALGGRGSTKSLCILRLARFSRRPRLPLLLNDKKHII